MRRTGAFFLVAMAGLATLIACTGEGSPARTGAQSTAAQDTSSGSPLETSGPPAKETGPLLKGTLRAASVAAGREGAAMSDLGVSGQLAMSADGNWLAMDSSSTNLLDGQHTGRPAFNQPQLFLHERSSRDTVLVSHNLGDATQAGVYKSGFADISADGRFVAYESSSYDLVPPPGGGRGQYPNQYPNQVYLYDRESGANVLISHGPGGAPAAGGSETVSISADGRWVAYGSSASDLVADQEDRRATGDVFVYDRESGENSLVSHAADREKAVADDQSDSPSISADGRFIAYLSLATNLVPGQDDQNGVHDLFLDDRERGETILVSRAGRSPTAACDYGVASERASISDDGRFVVYTSSAGNIVQGFKDESDDTMVYLFDRQTGENRLVSHAAGDALRGGAGIAEEASVSGDGSWVVFASEANDLVNSQTGPEVNRNIYLWERASDVTRLVSHRPGSTLASAGENSYDPKISRDGRYVAFESDAPDLMPGQVDEDMGLDVFLYGRETAAITLISHLAGSETTAANGGPGEISISDDGMVISFMSLEDGLVAEDTNGETDAFWFTRE